MQTSMMQHCMLYANIDEYCYKNNVKYSDKRYFLHPRKNKNEQTLTLMLETINKP